MIWCVDDVPISLAGFFPRYETELYVQSLYDCDEFFYFDKSSKKKNVIGSF